MNSSKIVTAFAAAALLLNASVAFAQVDVSAGAGASVNAGGANANANVNVDAALQARITKAKDRANQEIQRRTDMLSELNTRVQAMAHVSADEKTAVSTLVTTQISTLADLKTKIDGETDIAELKVDIQSIAQSYRIFMLVMPRARIDVAADKINTAAVAMTALSAKLQTRISGATGDAAAATAALADMNAKAADAKVQADAAVSLVATLQPDNGDKTVQTANSAALKDARAKIQVALKDLKDARQDAHTVVKWLHDVGASANASASSSVSTQ